MFLLNVQTTGSEEIWPVVQKEAFVGAPGTRSSLVLTLRSYLILRTTSLRLVL